MAEPEDIILNTTRLLAEPLDAELRMMPCGSGQFPSVEKLESAVNIAQKIIFPDFFDKSRKSTDLRSYFIGINVENLFSLLCSEIANALQFREICRHDIAEAKATEMTSAFISRLPDIKQLVYSDVEAIYQNDPAVDDYGEIVLCYPSIRAMLNYRIAHALLTLGVPVIPRMLTELAHSKTGIDINPGATIGSHFAIDHGTGVVIGETCIIGNHCTVYQGVTLGAKNFTIGSEGRPVNVPRHPVLEDNVTVYSNATILGRITVGHDSVIGGNVWLTSSVPPRSRILQPKALTASVAIAAGN